MFKKFVTFERYLFQNQIKNVNRSSLLSGQLWASYLNFCHFLPRLSHRFICHLTKCYFPPPSAGSKLPTCQFRAGYLLFCWNKSIRIIPILSDLHWLPIIYCIYFKIFPITYKTLNWPPHACPFDSILLFQSNCFLHLVSSLFFFFLAPTLDAWAIEHILNSLLNITLKLWNELFTSIHFSFLFPFSFFLKNSFFLSFFPLVNKIMPINFRPIYTFFLCTSYLLKKKRDERVFGPEKAT